MLTPRNRLDLPGLGRWHDLSGPIHGGMWSYGPPIAPVKIDETTTHSGPRHESNFTFTLPHLAGTYFEAPHHRLRDGHTMDAVELDGLIRPATVLSLPTVEPFTTLQLEDLVAATAGLPMEDAVLISTGWESHWEQQDFVSHSPHFSQGAMDWLIRKGVKLLGADLPCFDSPITGGHALDTFFKTGGNILAPVVGLRSIASHRVLLVIAPLPVQGVCGAPCRAYAAEWPTNQERELEEGPVDSVTD